MTLINRLNKGRGEGCLPPFGLYLQSFPASSQPASQLASGLEWDRHWYWLRYSSTCQLLTREVLLLLLLSQMRLKRAQARRNCGHNSLSWGAWFWEDCVTIEKSLIWKLRSLRLVFGRHGKLKHNEMNCVMASFVKNACATSRHLSGIVSTIGKDFATQALRRDVTEVG